MASRFLSNVEVKFIKNKKLIANEEEWNEDISEVFNGNIRVDNMTMNETYLRDGVLLGQFQYGYLPTRIVPVLDLDESLKNRIKDSFGITVKYKTYCYSSKKINSTGVVTIQDFESLDGHVFSNYVEGKHSIFLRTGEKGLTGNIGTRIYIE